MRGQGLQGGQDSRTWTYSADQMAAEESNGLTSIRAGRLRHGQWKTFSSSSAEPIDNFFQHADESLSFDLDYAPDGSWMLERSWQREGLNPHNALRLEQQNCGPSRGEPGIAANGIGAAALASIYSKRVLLAAARGDDAAWRLTLVIVDDATVRDDDELVDDATVRSTLVVVARLDASSSCAAPAFDAAGTGEMYRMFTEDAPPSEAAAVETALRILDDAPRGSADDGARRELGGVVARVAALCGVDDLGAALQDGFAYARLYWRQLSTLTFDVPGDVTKHATQLSMRYATPQWARAPDVRFGRRALKFATNDVLHHFLCELTSPEWDRVALVAGARCITADERVVRLEVRGLALEGELRLFLTQQDDVAVEAILNRVTNSTQLGTLVKGFGAHVAINGVYPYESQRGRLAMDFSSDPGAFWTRESVVARRVRWQEVHAFVDLRVTRDGREVDTGGIFGQRRRKSSSRCTRRSCTRSRRSS